MNTTSRAWRLIRNAMFALFYVLIFGGGGYVIWKRYPELGAPIVWAGRLWRYLTTDLPPASQPPSTWTADNLGAVTIVGIIAMIALMLTLILLDAVPDIWAELTRTETKRPDDRGADSSSTPRA